MMTSFLTLFIPKRQLGPRPLKYANMVDMSSSPAEIRCLHGIYDASGSLVGEISYFLQRVFLGRHCSLCDITHSTFVRRSAWNECVADLGLEFVLHHSDKIPDGIAHLPEYSAPCVVVEYSDGSLSMLVDAQELEQCDRSPDRLMKLVQSKIGNRQSS